LNRSEQELLVDFSTSPDQYRHWTIELTPPVATLRLGVDPDGGLAPGYELKLNSYDLGVDIELHDAVQRLRFEHPEIRAVVIASAIENVFCSGANIQMLAGSSHGHKVNFCKFTNETRNGIEEASAHSGMVFIAGVGGTAAGGGYELALACDEIVLVNDRASAVSLPEVPLLAVLPGTGGLTRLVDKRFVRRDLADVFATRAEGVRGDQALKWGLIDALASKTDFEAEVIGRATQRASESDRPTNVAGVVLTPLQRTIAGDKITYPIVEVVIDRSAQSATITVAGPDSSLNHPATGPELADAGAGAWILAAARELDDAILHLRFNEPDIGIWVLKTAGDGQSVARCERVLANDPNHWLAREVRLLWQRVLKRVELSARTIVALIEPGSCFTGTLAELALLADRTYMLEGEWEDPDDKRFGLAEAVLTLTEANDSWYRMSNGLSRLESRFWGHQDQLDKARKAIGTELIAEDALAVGLITMAMDDIDWDDEIRITIEERSSFSPDALTAMEANYRFVGPETMESKIFARLSAWQNWIFQRPNAVGPEGALRRFGTGSRPNYDKNRV